jgi:hypothetical protein
MSHYDTSIIEAERAYRAARIREQIVGRRQAIRLRKERARQRRATGTWES